VGWRDRDWAKFTDDEWRRLVGSHKPDPIRNTTALAPAPYAAPTRRSSHALTVTLVAALLSLLATIFGVLVHFRTVLHAPTSSPDPVNVVDIHWRASDLAPAATAGQVCVTTSTVGRVCATYVVGERPADALTVRLQSAGATVRSS
jgi:hypothetical protein